MFFDYLFDDVGGASVFKISGGPVTIKNRIFEWSCGHAFLKQAEAIVENI